LVAADGGIFTFGGAGFHGSLGNRVLPAAAATVATTPTGKGYWILLSNGDTFAFGDAVELPAST
jgi:hypothetical protein